MEFLGAAGAVGSVIAAIGAIALLWINRKREPFELTRVNETTMQLRRVRHPAVVILEDPYVLCHGPVATLHRAGTLQNHLLKFGDSRLLDVTGVSLGESIAFRYVRVWSLRPSQQRVVSDRARARWARKLEDGKAPGWGGDRV